MLHSFLLLYSIMFGTYARCLICYSSKGKLTEETAQCNGVKLLKFTAFNLVPCAISTSAIWTFPFPQTGKQQNFVMY